MALAGVEGTISGDAGNLLIGWDLVEQFGQHGRIAHIAGGELGSPDFQRLLVNSDVDLAPRASVRHWSEDNGERAVWSHRACV